MEVIVLVKNALQAELETEGSRLATVFGLPLTLDLLCSSDVFKWYSAHEQNQGS